MGEGDGVDAGHMIRLLAQFTSGSKIPKDHISLTQSKVINIGGGDADEHKGNLLITGSPM